MGNLPFERSEYEKRLERVREAMSEAGHEALVVVDPANLNYLTGYDAWSFYTPQALIVPLEGEMLFFTREMDVPGAFFTTILNEDQVFGFPENLVHRPDAHPFDWITQELRSRGFGKLKIAVEKDAHFFSPRAYEALVAGLSGAEFTDSQELVNWVRSVKSPAEIEKMRQAGRIVERVMRAGIDAVEPGVRQCDAVAQIYAAQARGTEEAGGEYTAFVPLLPTGPATSTPHLTWSDAPFKEGEGTLLELAAAYHRYHCPLARTVFLGEPPQRLTDTAEIVEEGLEAALEAARPGGTCEGVEAAWRSVIERHGLSKKSRIGYSIGIGYPPDWGERTMSLRPGDKTELKPGMAFHMILGMWMDDWGFELSESFVVTDSGAECLSNFPRGLTVKR